MTGQIYALKVLRKDNIIKRNQVEHTKTERSVLGYVRHPFIVGMNMAFQSKDKLYFVLDYCAGGELFFHLGKIGKFPESRACFYAAEIILAISYVHSLDIIYRDLKPGTLLSQYMKIWNIPLWSCHVTQEKLEFRSASFAWNVFSLS